MREVEADRQKQTDRQTDRQAGRQAGRQTKSILTLTHAHGGHSESCREFTCKLYERGRQRQTDRHRQTGRKTDRHRQTERQENRQTQTH